MCIPTEAELAEYWFRRCQAEMAHAADLTQQLAALRSMFTVREFHDGTYAVSVPHEHWESIRALLAPPAGEPDDEIRMPMTPGIPGIGVVVSSGPRPELVIEADPPDGDAAP